MSTYKESFFVEKEVAVTAKRAWEIISQPAGLTAWHPFMETHTAERWDGVGSRDQLTYYSGLVYDREVVRWLDGIGYDLKVTENGKRECSAV